MPKLKRKADQELVIGDRICPFLAGPMLARGASRELLKSEARCLHGYCELFVSGCVLCDAVFSLLETPVRRTVCQ